MRSPGTAEDEQESPCAAHQFGPEAEVAPSGRAVATQGRLRSASGQAARRIDSGRAADDVGEIIEGRSAGLCKSEQVGAERRVRSRSAVVCGDASELELRPFCVAVRGPCSWRRSALLRRIGALSRVIVRGRMLFSRR